MKSSVWAVQRFYGANEINECCLLQAKMSFEMRDSLSSSYSQVVLIELYPFWRSSLLKSMPQPQIGKKR